MANLKVKTFQNPNPNGSVRDMDSPVGGYFVTPLPELIGLSIIFIGSLTHPCNVCGKSFRVLIHHATKNYISVKIVLSNFMQKNHESRLACRIIVIIFAFRLWSNNHSEPTRTTNQTNWKYLCHFPKAKIIILVK